MSELINAATDVEDLITRSFAALDDCLGYPHAIRECWLGVRDDFRNWLVTAA